jgi:hypothetical protein
MPKIVKIAALLGTAFSACNSSTDALYGDRASVESTSAECRIDWDEYLRIIYATFDAPSWPDPELDVVVSLPDFPIQNQPFQTSHQLRNTSGKSKTLIIGTNPIGHIFFFRLPAKETPQPHTPGGRDLHIVRRPVTLGPKASYGAPHTEEEVVLRRPGCYAVVAPAFLRDSTNTESYAVYSKPQAIYVAPEEQSEDQRIR